MSSNNSSVASSAVPAVVSLLSASAAAVLLMRSNQKQKNRRHTTTDKHHSPNKDANSVGTDITAMTDMFSASTVSTLDIESTIRSIKKDFPNAIPNHDLVNMLGATLHHEGFDRTTTLVATALCCDEVNRPLVDDLETAYGQTFTMGGLAGFAFGGVTSFGAMAHHIPDGGNCLVVYGPHVGVDSHGKVGTVNRRGRKHGGACCGSAAAAAGHVHECFCRKASGSDDATISAAVTDPLDAQQQFVNNLLMPYAKRLEEAGDKSVELPQALFDAQNGLLQRIVAKGSSNVGENGKIALVGGIQINTPQGMQDYFLPLKFELRNNKGALLEDFMEHKHSIESTVESITQHFPRAIPNNAVVNRVKTRLSEFGYGNSTLLATSLCCDEVNKPLIDDFSAIYGNNFNMGGLAGFAFGGVTSFGAMAHHIPDNGSCLIVFGPHVGVDSNGKVGTVDRRGRKAGGACCGSACAAAGYVASHAHAKGEAPTDCLDAQQTFVNNMLLPQAERLSQAQNKMVELPFALYDAQKDLMERIVNKGCSNVGGSGKIALLGGIQINTPEGMHDYFLPLTFLLRSNKDETIEDLLWED